MGILQKLNKLKKSVNERERDRQSGVCGCNVPSESRNFWCRGEHRQQASSGCLALFEIILWLTPLLCFLNNTKQTRVSALLLSLEFGLGE